MRFWKLAAVTMLVSCVNADEAESQKAIVYFYGFEIERITGIHESEIEQLGCRYEGSADKLEQTMSLLVSDVVDYNQFDIRAMIQIHGMTYFVDRNGIVRQQDRFFALDKEMFVGSIKLVGPCN